MNSWFHQELLWQRGTLPSGTCHRLQSCRKMLPLAKLRATLPVAKFPWISHLTLMWLISTALEGGVFWVFFGENIHCHKIPSIESSSRKTEQTNNVLLVKIGLGRFGIPFINIYHHLPLVKGLNTHTHTPRTLINQPSWEFGTWTWLNSDPSGAWFQWFVEVAPQWSSDTWMVPSLFNSSKV